LLRDVLAIDQGASRLRGAAKRRVATQAPIRIASLSRAGYADFVFAFHDGEEIGPKMLARIAKHTGITPSDL